MWWSLRSGREPPGFHAPPWAQLKGRNCRWARTSHVRVRNPGKSLQGHAFGPVLYRSYTVRPAVRAPGKWWEWVARSAGCQDVWGQDRSGSPLDETGWDDVLLNR